MWAIISIRVFASDVTFPFIRRLYVAINLEILDFFSDFVTVLGPGLVFGTALQRYAGIFGSQWDPRTGDVEFLRS